LRNEPHLGRRTTPSETSNNEWRKRSIFSGRFTIHAKSLQRVQQVYEPISWVTGHKVVMTPIYLIGTRWGTIKNEGKTPIYVRFNPPMASKSNISCWWTLASFAMIWKTPQSRDRVQSPNRRRIARGSVPTSAMPPQDSHNPKDVR
jgi:hypothetical protein